MAIIYMAVNIVNNKCYIGKTTGILQKRKNRHFNATDKGSVLYFHKAIRKYGKDKFEFDIVEEIPKEEANKAEIFWIAYYKSIGVELYNMTKGGDGFSLGHKYNVGNKYNVGKSNSLGYKHTDETKGKISKANLGHIHTEEAKEKMSIKSLGKNKFVKTYTGFVSPEGIIYAPVKNLSAFCKEHNLNQGHLWSISVGKKQHYKGWTLYNN